MIFAPFDIHPPLYTWQAHQTDWDEQYLATPINIQVNNVGTDARLSWQNISFGHTHFLLTGSKNGQAITPIEIARDQNHYTFLADAGDELALTLQMFDKNENRMGNSSEVFDININNFAVSCKADAMPLHYDNVDWGSRYAEAPPNGQLGMSNSGCGITLQGREYAEITLPDEVVNYQFDPNIADGPTGYIVEFEFQSTDHHGDYLVALEGGENDITYTLTDRMTDEYAFLRHNYVNDGDWQTFSFYIPPSEHEQNLRFMRGVDSGNVLDGFTGSSSFRNITFRLNGTPFFPGEKPQNLTYDVKGNAVTLNWDDDLARVFEVLVYEEGELIAIKGPFSESQITIDELTKFTTYQFEVTALYSDMSSPASEKVEVFLTDVNPLPAPENIRFEREKEGYYLRWGEHPQAQSYVLEVTPGPCHSHIACPPVVIDPRPPFSIGNSTEYFIGLPEADFSTFLAIAASSELIPKQEEVTDPLTYSEQIEFFPEDANCPLFDYPSATTVVSHQSQANVNDGSITFNFYNDKKIANTYGKRTKIKFSLDGGQSYIGKVKDKKGSYTVNNLQPGEYDLALAWGNGECAIDIPDVVIESAENDECANDYPNVSISDVQNDTGGQDGLISFEFTDDKTTGGDRSHIKFSLDDGNSYSHKIKDSAGAQTINGLAHGDYEVWAAWGNGDCPIKVSDINIPLGLPPME